jgi:aspartokinase
LEGLLSLLVLKFGGTSVADVDRIRNVAAHVKREVDAGHACAVVVSAMAGHTNQLVAWVEQAWGFRERKQKGSEASAHYDGREYDAVVSSGEQVTSGLLALVLQSLGSRRGLGKGGRFLSIPMPRIAPPASPGSTSTNLRNGCSTAKWR